MPRALVLRGAPRPDLPLLDLCALQDDKPLPAPGPHDVIVKITCRPVSPADVICMKGKCQEFHPGEYPATPGLEGCGVVHQVGADVSSVKEGDRVVPLVVERGHLGDGTWQEMVVVPEDLLVKIPDGIPDGIPDDMAAQAFLNPASVMGIMETLGIPPGEYLVCVGAESTYDKETIAYAHKQGVKAICVIMDDAAKRELRGYGADVLVNAAKEDAEARVMEVTGGKGAWGAVCPAGGNMPTMLASCTRRGRYCHHRPGFLRR